LIDCPSGPYDRARVDVRVGTGYDLHRFGEDRRLILAGVHFEGERGLAGHSDADVVTHAVIDAILGAAGLGDIGTHFPPSDARYAGVDSMHLLRESLALVRANGWQLMNVDTTIIAERPRMSERVPAMRTSLAGALGVDIDCVSVKSKTNEGVGALGSGEAIAVLAAALISRDT
jgi:2-C-methyl-D-erythritol 2,4-cyclodiphosphate synthase